MRILIVGAGATGGAFGSLLQEAGRDVTYLVRQARAVKLRRDGLRFISPWNDRLQQVQTIIAGEAAGQFDLVLLTVKANGLEAAITDLRPFIGPQTYILPFLNGMAHIDRLSEEFPNQILGGLVKVVATLDGDTVKQLTELTALTIGTLTDANVPAGIVEALEVPGIELTVSTDILTALWEKWAFIAAAGVITCLFRGPVGKILEAGGLAKIGDAINELESVAANV